MTPRKGDWEAHVEADWVRVSKSKRLRFLRSQLISQCAAFLRSGLVLNSFDLTKCTVMKNPDPLSEVLTWIRFNWRVEMPREASPPELPIQKPKIELISYKPLKVNAPDDELEKYIETDWEVLK